MAIDPIFGSIISAGATLLGGKLGADSSAKAARLNAIAQANEAAIARDYNAAEAEKAYKRNRADYLVDAAREEALQREFAQQGVRWRVEDAKAAGLHPLAALGAQVSSYSPVQVGGGGYEGQKMPRYSPSPYSGASPAAGLAAAGQDISRGIAMSHDAQQRAEAYQKTMADLQVQRGGLENLLLASQIAKINSAGQAPLFPSGKSMIDGQGNSPKRIKMDPMQIEYSAPANKATEPGPITDVGHLVTRNTPSGSYIPVPSKLAKERIEDDLFQQLDHFVRNRLLPIIGANFNPPNVPLMAGKEWQYHPIRGYEQWRKKSTHVSNPSWYKRGSGSAAP